MESANKLLVQARLKGAGMRWAPTSVNPMVALRTVAYSDRWAEAVPLISGAQRRARQARTTQRRTARQHARARLAEEHAQAAAAPPSPSCPTSVPAPLPMPAAPPRPHSRKPAPDHPWHRPFVSHRRSA